MSEEVRKAVVGWMNGLGIRNPEELAIEDWTAVKKLLGNDRPGFGVFLSMMMFERQKAVAQLTNADLSSSIGAVAAAKLQGIILCVDMMRELVLNIADPSGEGSNSTDREIAGVRFNANGNTERSPLV